MMNGVERTAFTRVPIILLARGFGMIPLGEVMKRNTPKRNADGGSETSGNTDHQYGLKKGVPQQLNNIR